MIALVTTYFLVLYILFPGVLFRFVTSWFVELRLFERTRTQEATFAVQVALLPFFLALFGVWFLPILRAYPFPIPSQTYAQRRADYHRVTTLLTTSDSSKLLQPGSSALPAVEPDKPQANPVWPSLNRVLRRQARFLSWYYLFTAIEAICFGFLAGKYGDWQILENSSTQQTVPIHKRLYNWAAPRLILPNISEWYMLLTDFSWPKQEKIFVRVDILQSDGLLYKGTVVDYFIDAGGKLTGIQLEAVNRFDRQAYHEAQKAAPAGSESSSNHISTDDFWRNIPSSRFYIGQSSITNLNVRFVPQDQSLIGIAETILAENNTHVDSVSVWRGYDSADPDSHHPDIYS